MTLCAFCSACGAEFLPEDTVRGFVLAIVRPQKDAAGNVLKDSQGNALVWFDAQEPEWVHQECEEMYMYGDNPPLCTSCREALSDGLSE